MERIVDQVVNPKIYSLVLPKIEDITYKYLGIEKPTKSMSEHLDYSYNKLTVETDLMPTDLEAVSPDSEKSGHKSGSFEKLNDMDELANSLTDDVSEKNIDDDESPPFEPLEELSNNSIKNEESNSSITSAISGLTSQGSIQSVHSAVNGKEDLLKSEVTKVDVTSDIPSTSMEVDDATTTKSVIKTDVIEQVETPKEVPIKMEIDETSDDPRSEGNEGSKLHQDILEFSNKSATEMKSEEITEEAPIINTKVENNELEADNLITVKEESSGEDIKYPPEIHSIDNQCVIMKSETIEEISMDSVSMESLSSGSNPGALFIDETKDENSKPKFDADDTSQSNHGTVDSTVSVKEQQVENVKDTGSSTGPTISSTKQSSSGKSDSHRDSRGHHKSSKSDRDRDRSRHSSHHKRSSHSRSHHHSSTSNKSSRDHSKSTNSKTGDGEHHISSSHTEKLRSSSSHHHSKDGHSNKSRSSSSHGDKIRKGHSSSPSTHRSGDKNERHKKTDEDDHSLFRSKISERRRSNDHDSNDGSNNSEQPKGLSAKGNSTACDPLLSMSNTSSSSVEMEPTNSTETQTIGLNVTSIQNSFAKAGIDTNGSNEDIIIHNTQPVVIDSVLRTEDEIDLDKLLSSNVKSDADREKMLAEFQNTFPSSGDHIKKPRMASNMNEAKKLMKVRKQIDRDQNKQREKMMAMAKKYIKSDGGFMKSSDQGFELEFVCESDTNMNPQPQLNDHNKISPIEYREMDVLYLEEQNVTVITRIHNLRNLLLDYTAVESLSLHDMDVPFTMAFQALIKRPSISDFDDNGSSAKRCRVKDDIIPIDDGNLIETKMNCVNNNSSLVLDRSESVTEGEQSGIYIMNQDKKKEAKRLKILTQKHQR